VSASNPPIVDAPRAEGWLEGVGGKRLFWRSYVPDEPRAVVLLAHGASEHGDRYRYVVERLVPDGFAVYAVDHRGHGRSDGSRAMLDRMDHVVADFDRLAEHARAQHPGLRLFLLGHSMGGTVALAYALRHQAKLAGLALSAPLAALEAAPLPLRVVARALSVVAPTAGVYDVEAEGVSRDLDEVRAYDEDPLVYRGKLPARTVQEIADTIAGFHDAVPSLTLPTLVMHGTADRIVPIAAAEMIALRSGASDLTFHRYDGFYHEIFNEPAGERDRPLGDLAAWLSDRA